MEKTAGYRNMLRDRLPTTANYALKWQKAKERWINHTYRNLIWVWSNKEDRRRVTKIILGIAKHYKPFDFRKSIDWDNLNKDETAYWERISSWVDWFENEYSSIKDEYETSVENGEDEFTIKVNIINNHLSELLPSEDASWDEKIAKYQYVDDLVNFLVKCFNNRI